MRYTAALALATTTSAVKLGLGYGYGGYGSSYGGYSDHAYDPVDLRRFIGENAYSQFDELTNYGSYASPAQLEYYMNQGPLT